MVNSVREKQGLKKLEIIAKLVKKRPLQTRDFGSTSSRNRRQHLLDLVEFGLVKLHKKTDGYTLPTNWRSTVYFERVYSKIHPKHDTGKIFIDNIFPYYKVDSEIRFLFLFASEKQKQLDKYQNKSKRWYSLQQARAKSDRIQRMLMDLKSMKKTQQKDFIDGLIHEMERARNVLDTDVLLSHRERYHLKQVMKFAITQLELYDKKPSNPEKLYNIQRAIM